MAKSKISSDDFARFLEDSDESAAFSPMSQPSSPMSSSQKVETKWRQTEDKVETINLLNRGQSGDKVETSAPTLSPLSDKSGDKVGTQPETHLETKWRQTEDKVETNASFSSLVGLQRKLIILFYQSCKAARSSTTEPLAIGHIATCCETSINSVKKTIQRLEQRNFLSRFSFKDGRGGWTQYVISHNVFQDLLRAETEDKLETKWRQTRDKVGTQLGTQLETSPPSSSRDLYLNNSTTTQNVDNFGPNAGALKNLDFSTVTEFGITISTLNRCRELYPSVSNDQLIALTERFGQFMKTQDAKRVQNARGFFISLAEQLSKGVTPLDHIETREQALMREFVERAKEAKVRRELLEKEALEFAFEEWFENLDAKSRDELVAPNSVIESGSKIQMMKLKEHFRLSVWPTRFAVSKEALEADA
jgi:hypothetical protein